MLFRRLAIALILTMAVALVGIACAEGATATPEAMRERQDSTSYTSGLGFVQSEGYINCGAGDGDARADSDGRKRRLRSR